VHFNSDWTLDSGYEEKSAFIKPQHDWLVIIRGNLLREYNLEDLEAGSSGISQAEYLEEILAVSINSNCCVRYVICVLPPLHPTEVEEASLIYRAVDCCHFCHPFLLVWSDKFLSIAFMVSA
jgi:hypothetical protein